MVKLVHEGACRRWWAALVCVVLIAAGAAPAHAYSNLGGALDAPLPWTTSGSAAWFAQSTTSHDGASSAQSGAILHNESSTLQADVTGPAVVSFWWKVSSEPGWDYLRFRIDGVDVPAVPGISGEVDWTRVSVVVPAGTHSLTWTYSKDGSVVLGSDAGWVDEVSVVPGNAVLQQAAGGADLVWSTNGDNAWFAQSAVTHDGVSALQSGTVGDGQSTTLQAAATGPGLLSFWWKVSSEGCCDLLRLRINDVEVVPGIGGEQDWNRVEVSLLAGTHTLTWTYSKNPSAISGSDAAWVDEVTFVAGSGAVQDAVDNPALPWSTAGASAWFPQSAVSHDGVDAVQSGAILEYQSSVLGTTVTGPGVLSFWWKVSSELNYDFLRFLLDGVELPAIPGISGEADWTQVNVLIPEGTHSLGWRYSKDGSVVNGSDAGWVDEVTFAAGATVTLAEALDAPGLTWTTDANAWGGRTDVTHDGADAARSAPIDHGQASSLRTVVTGPGALSFRWKVSSEEGYDYLRFSIDGVDVVPGISGEVDWTQVTVPVPAGTHVLAWTYSKDGSVVHGSDAGWVDQVAYTPDFQPIPAPTGLTASSVNSSRIDLSWSSAPGHSAAILYKVYRGGVHVASVSYPVTNYSDVGLSSTTTYTYTVQACDGGNCSVLSAPASATTSAVPVYQLTVTVAGGGSVLSFPSGISCGATCAASFTQGTTVILTAIAAGGFGLTGWGGACAGAGGECHVLVDAAKTVTATFADTQAPDVPTLAASAAYGQVSLSWTPVADNVGVTQYHVFRNSQSLTTVIGTPPGTTYIDAAVAASTNYSYTVQACDAAGTCSAQSAAVTARTLALPFRESPIPTVVARANQSFALKSDGSVHAWGANDSAQLGDGTTADRSAPVPISAILTVKALAPGERHTVALRDDRFSWAWGANTDGQIGDATNDNRSAPVFTRAAPAEAIAAGKAHSLADGTYAWGANGSGQLGDGTTMSRNQPVEAGGSLPGVGVRSVVALAAGDYFSLALSFDGTVWAWGANASGQLGDGTTSDRLVPVQVPGLFGIVAIAAGGAHALALRHDGAVFAWGANGAGQLGDGSTTPRSTPAAVPGLTGVKFIAAAADHSAAITNSGTVMFWGSSAFGESGNGGTVPVPSPLAVPAFGTARSVALGDAHTIVLRTDGSVWAAGRNDRGQLGDGTTANRSSPVRVSGPGGSGFLYVPDTLPDSMEFLPPKSPPQGSTHTAGPAVVSGIDTAVALSITGGQYRVNGGAFSTAPRVVNNGDSIDLRFTVPTGNCKSLQVKLVVGDRVAGFALSTSCPTPPINPKPTAPQNSGTGARSVSGPSTCLALSESSIDLGARLVNTTSSARAVRLVNECAHTVSSIAFTDLWASNAFVRSGAPAGAGPTCGTSLNAGQSCSIGIAARPPARGTSIGQIVVNSTVAAYEWASTQSLNLSGTGAAVPGAPTAVAAATVAGSVTVSFTPPADDGGAPVTQYTVFTAPPSPGAAVAVANGSGSPIVVGGLASGTSYAFTVRATNAAGMSAASSTSNSVTLDTTHPSAPGGLTATAVGATEIALSWTAATDNVAVTHYLVHRNGVLRTTVNAPATSFGDTGLASATAYTYTVAACDAQGNCSVPPAVVSASTLPPPVPDRTFTLPLEPGFNLAGNSLDITLDVAARFGSQDAPVAGVTEKVISVWKWNAEAGKWAFHSPQLTAAGNAAYAVSRNYDPLNTINPGEGYWVNAVEAVTLPPQSGKPFVWNAVSFSALPAGFNLITSASDATPSQFNAQVSATPPAPGATPTDNFVSLWVWDAVLGKWYFHSPILEATGGLPAVKAYADGHNYLHFQDHGKTLDVGTGFWVNRP